MSDSQWLFPSAKKFAFSISTVALFLVGLYALSPSLFMPRDAGAAGIDGIADINLILAISAFVVFLLAAPPVLILRKNHLKFKPNGNLLYLKIEKRDISGFAIVSSSGSVSSAHHLYVRIILKYHDTALSSIDGAGGQSFKARQADLLLPDHSAWYDETIYGLLPSDLEARLNRWLEEGR